MKMVASVYVVEGIEELSVVFDADTVDHNDLAVYIGRAVVSAINKVRARGESVFSHTFEVELYEAQEG